MLKTSNRVLRVGNTLGFQPWVSELSFRARIVAPSSSGLERLFSTLGFAYGKLRGQLGVEKAEKVAFPHNSISNWCLIVN